MATINYTSSLSLILSTTIRISTSYQPDITGFQQGPIARLNVITNTLSSETYNYSSISTNYPDFTDNPILPRTFSLVATNAFSAYPNYSDGVYENSLFNVFATTGEDAVFESTAYLLVTTQIDAAIAAYPQATFFDRANLAAIQYLREQIDIAYADEDYALTNSIIGNCLTYIGYTSSNLTLAVATLSKTNNSTLLFNATTNPSTSTPTVSQYNEILNTLTNDLDAFTNTALIPNGTGSYNIDSNTTFLEPYFADGVLQVKSFYISPTYLNLDDNTLTQQTGYVLITTSIDALYINFLSGYDPNNPADVYYNNLLLDYFGQITTLSSNLATNYEAINDLIEQIQAILNQEVQEVYFVLVNPSEFIINYGLNNLPSGTYTDQLLTITQLGTDNEYDILNFPNDDTDVTTTVSSEDFNGSEEYPDGVYLLSGTYTVDGEIYTVEEHALVLTGIDSGMAAFGVKLACACSERLAMKGCTLLTYYDAIERTFAEGEYTSTITLIKKLQNLLNKQGCGCGC
jgi:hypothetical protein